MSDSPTTYSRRQAVGLLAALGGAAAGGLTVAELLQAGELKAGPVTPGGLTPEVLARFARNLDGEAVGTIGRAYLSMHPDEADLSLLVGRILEESEDDQHVSTVVRSRVAGDYDQGRVWRSDGWLLSRTEGRIFAAVSLAG